jgi:hypothetical protein
MFIAASTIATAMEHVDAQTQEAPPPTTQKESVHVQLGTREQDVMRVPQVIGRITKHAQNVLGVRRAINERVNVLHRVQGQRHDQNHQHQRQRHRGTKHQHMYCMCCRLQLVLLLSRWVVFAANAMLLTNLKEATAVFFTTLHKVKAVHTGSTKGSKRRPHCGEIS